MIKVILWDVDGTLLDFKASERVAIRYCLKKFGVCDATDEMIGRYSEINQKYWKMLEDGLISKPQVLTGRFNEFFKSEGLVPCDLDALNAEYQQRLGDNVFYSENAVKVLNELKGKIKQYAVTNGTTVAQDKKLKKSGLIDILDGVFISERVGFEKPSFEFFKRVFDKIGDYEKSEIMIVGDSLTGDIRGGINAGILTCWYDPSAKENNTDYIPNYMITDLTEVIKIVYPTD